MKQINIKDKCLLQDENSQGEILHRSTSSMNKDKLFGPINTQGNLQIKKSIQNQHKKIIDILENKQNNIIEAMNSDQMISPWDSKENINDFPSNEQGDDNFLPPFSINQNDQNYKEEVNIQQKKFIVPSPSQRINTKFLNNSPQKFNENSQYNTNYHDYFSLNNQQLYKNQNVNLNGNQFSDKKQVDLMINHDNSSRSTDYAQYSTNNEQIKLQSLIFKNQQYQLRSLNQNVVDDNASNTPDEYNNVYKSSQIKYKQTESELKPLVDEKLLKINKNEQNLLITDCNNQIKIIDPSSSNISVVSPRFIHISEAPGQGINNQKIQQRRKLYTEQYAQIAQMQKHFAKLKDNSVSNIQKIQLDQKDIIHPDLFCYFNKNDQAQFKQLISYLSPNFQDEEKNGVSLHKDQIFKERQCQKQKIQTKNQNSRCITLQQLLDKNTNFQNYIDSRINNPNPKRASLELSPQRFIKIQQTCQQNLKNKNSQQLTSSLSYNFTSLSQSQTSRSNEIFKTLSPSLHLPITTKSISHHQNNNNQSKMTQTNRQYTQNGSEEISNDLMIFKRVFPNSQQHHSNQNQIQIKQNLSLLSQNLSSNQKIQKDNRLMSVQLTDDQTNTKTKGNKQNENNYLNQRNHYNQQNIFISKENVQIKVNSGFTSPNVNSNRVQNSIQSERHSKKGSLLSLESLINKTNKLGDPSYICETERACDFKYVNQIQFPNIQITEEFALQKDNQQVPKKSKIHLNQNLLKHKQHLQAKKQKQIEEEKNHFLAQAHLHNQCTQILKNILQESSRKKNNISQKNFNLQSINMQLNKQNEFNIIHIDNSVK